MELFLYSNNFRGSPNGWSRVCNANFLVGENSSGKSSFGMLCEIALSHKFITSSSCTDIIKNLDEFDDFWSKLSGVSDESSVFTIGIYWSTDKLHKFGKIVSFENDNGDAKIKRVSIVRDRKFKKIQLQDDKMLRIESSRKGSSHRPEFHVKQLLRFHEEEHKSGKVVFETEKGQISKVPSLLISFLLEQDIDESGGGANLTLTPETYPFRKRTHAFGPMRSKPERVHFVGKRDFDPEGAATITQIKKSLSEGKFYESLKKFGKASGLYEDVKVVDTSKQVGRNSFVMKFTKSGVDYFPDELGYGLSQVMPLITDTLTRSKNSLVIIQQPELHLHPKAQAAFGDVLLQLANSGGYFIVETHSDFVIDRYRVGISKMRKKKKPTSQVLFFYATPTGNKVDSILISNDGTYENPQKRYREFFLKEQMRMLDAL